MATIRTSLNRFLLVIVTACTVPAVQGAESAASAPGALSPTQITAIRAVGRAVLAAKKSGGANDSAEAEQLDRLRATVDRLLAAEMDPAEGGRITLQEAGNATPRGGRERVTARRESVRAETRAFAMQLRGHGELKAAHARSAPGAGGHSGGFPIDEQRSRLLTRWSDKLIDLSAEDAPNRLEKLLALRERLQPASALSHAPHSRGTPTLQAMPADHVSPKTAEGLAKK